MARGKELSPQIHSRICELKSIGWSYGKIKERYPEIPLGTIRSTIRSEATRKDNESKPRSGRPKGLTDEQCNRLIQLASSNPQIKLSELVAAVDGAVQRRTIQRLLRESHLQRARPTNIKKPS